MPLACERCAIRNLSLCGALSDEEIGALNAISTRRKLSAGEIYAVEGDEAQTFANVVDGVAKLVRGMEDGREQIVGLLFPSDFMGRTFGEVRPARIPYTVEAATDLEICTFNSASFEAAVEEFPALERKLLQRTLNELDAARDWMLLLGRKSAGERVATFLHHIAKRCMASHCGDGGTQYGFDLPLSRSDMADFIGLTIETVSRQISKLRKDGILVMDGTRRVASVDMERLSERAGH
ncbi:MAG: Crp/Fnr family transcriptional regulator [Pseudomonadota bacterium]